ncbi:MAG: PEP-CTERM sorting domain-containing protein [Gammaproteobacteria bacterium]|nr:PEP-CTERM sorting domain-containing protein [Gammaproteobacteria bacterium]
MKIGIKLFSGALLVAFSFAAQATPTFVNFQTLADASSGNPLSYGESAWARESDPAAQPRLNLNADFGVDVSLFGVYGNNEAYAYLDKGTAGLGVCRQVYSNAVLGKHPGSGSNLCNPSSDDNVSGIGEALKLVFNEDIQITKIWFNNNHDPDYGLTEDTITIGGVDHTFHGSANNPSLGWLFSFSGTDGIFSANDTLSIAYYTGTALRAEEFYVSAIEFDTVPEPSVAALLSIGLLGLGMMRRRALANARD